RVCSALSNNSAFIDEFIGQNWQTNESYITLMIRDCLCCGVNEDLKMISNASTLFRLVSINYI
ncbi:hypothetical protein, partial [Vibrio parahaemolyticus]|uniref:hypothetical protein n=1 Tax=Vibrio parahaemolyticus TaxID=670 RepID=UPI0035C0D6D3